MNQSENNTALWKYETHSHTVPVSSCSRLTPAQLVENVAAKGYQALVISDHYCPTFFQDARVGKAYQARLKEYFKGYRDAAKIGKRVGLTVLPCAELTISAGPEDFLLYGFNEEIARETGCLSFLSLEEVRKKLAPYNVLIVQAHPFRRYLRSADPALLDGVEVYNGNPRHDSQNPMALQFAQDNHLLMTAGSDVHQTEDFGRAWMMLPPAQNESELADLIRKFGHEIPPIKEFT